MPVISISRLVYPLKHIGRKVVRICQDVSFCLQIIVFITVCIQVTTHSKLLTEQERLDLCQHLPVCAITLLSLQAFDTEQQFCQQLRSERERERERHCVRACVLVLILLICVLQSYPQELCS